MHAHVTDNSDLPFEMYLAKGVTTIRDPGSNITYPAFYAQISIQERKWGRGISLRVLFWMGFHQFGRMVPSCRHSGTSRNAVNFLIDQGVDFVKSITTSKSPSSSQF